MGRIFGGRDVWVRYLNRFRRVQTRRLCNAGNKPTSISGSSSVSDGTNGLEKVDGSSSSSSLSKYDAYKDLDKLDFMTATKILFTEPSKKKKFGFDFHLVQLFFACMPSLAVYLVAQYARYEMRRMEAELEEKKKVEEEAKAKEMELKAAEEKEARAADPELLEVKNRLDKLEEAVKEIFVETKNQPGSNTTENRQDIGGERQSATNAPSHLDQSKVTNSTAERTTEGKATSSGQSKASGLTPVAKSSQQDQMGSQRGGPSQEGKK